MILYEFEGKEILAKNGIHIPKFQLLTSSTQKVTIKTPFFAKAQTLSGKRKEKGGVIEIQSHKEIQKQVGNLFGTTINKEEVSKVLLEEKVDYKNSYYVSISYDTNTRGPVLSFSESGGTGIEERKVEVFGIDPISYSIDARLGKKIPSNILKIISTMVDIFFSQDLLLLEVNPLVIDEKGKVWALDAKVKTDDSAKARHADWNYTPRSAPGHKPTQREVDAKRIDEGDYRGTAGSAYFDLAGDIAILASGGGASLTAMDALLAAGGKPANYTEYSGNPPKEKVEKLTKIVLSKPGLNGLWVVGAVANFTDIYQTLSGFLEALRKVKPKVKFPIIIRRGGPRDAEAFEMLKKVKDFDLHLFGPETSIYESARTMVKEAKKYAATS